MPHWLVFEFRGDITAHGTPSASLLRPAALIDRPTCGLMFVPTVCLDSIRHGAPDAVDGQMAVDPAKAQLMLFGDWYSVCYCFDCWG